MQTINKLSIETDGSVTGTTIKINDVAIGAVQELHINVLADPENHIFATIKYWRTAQAVTPLLLQDLKDHYSGVYSAYITPFTDNLILEEETIVLVNGD